VQHGDNFFSDLQSRNETIGSDQMLEVAEKLQYQLVQSVYLGALIALGLKRDRRTV